MTELFLSKQCTEGFLNLADGMEFDAELRAVETLQVVAGKDEVGEAQLLCFGNASLDAADGTYFATQSNLACHAPSALDGGGDIR